MKKLTIKQKNKITGGSFYAIALGIGILVSTFSSAIINSISALKSSNGFTSYVNHHNAVIRLSPVPSRSSISFFN
jgi:hypothetical protein